VSYRSTWRRASTIGCTVMVAVDEVTIRFKSAFYP
jgi:hypothetical protein